MLIRIETNKGMKQLIPLVDEDRVAGGNYELKTAHSNTCREVFPDGGSVRLREVWTKSAC